MLRHRDTAALGGIGELLAVTLALRRQRLQQIDAGMMAEGVGDAHPLGFGTWIASLVAERKFLEAGDVRRHADDGEAVGDHRLVFLVGAIPFQHGEFRRMRHAALAIAEDAGEIEDPRLARRQQFLGREFRRGVQVERLARATGRDQLGRESMQMRLVAGRHLQGGRLDLDEAGLGKPGAQGGDYTVAGEQERPAIGVSLLFPERRRSLIRCLHPISPTPP